MKKLALFTILLIFGLLFSKIFPLIITSDYRTIFNIIFVLTFIALSIIMILTGFEFEIDKNNLKNYGIAGPIVFAAIPNLELNLILIVLFSWIVKKFSTQVKLQLKIK
jgi:hypothetical protein